MAATGAERTYVVAPNCVPRHPDARLLATLMSRPPAPAITAGCPNCGCTEVHACPGHPIVWTAEEEAALKVALSTAFGWPENIVAAD